MKTLIKKFAKKSGKNEHFVAKQCLEIINQLSEQGMKKSDIRFSIYLTTILKNKLEINETNSLILRFKDFLSENKKKI